MMENGVMLCVASATEVPQPMSSILDTSVQSASVPDQRCTAFALHRIRGKKRPHGIKRPRAKLLPEVRNP
jgi:hypothetical protein